MFLNSGEVVSKGLIGEFSFVAILNVYSCPRVVCSAYGFKVCGYPDDVLSNCFVALLAFEAILTVGSSDLKPVAVPINVS